MQTTSATLLPLLLLAAAVLVGAGLLWRGLRGRRVDDHPLCRRCGFDLAGLPAGSGRCSECGADVAAPRAVVVGHRERRRGLIAAGLALLIPAVLVGGGASWWAASGFDPTPYKPVWLLMRQADAAPSPGADAARDELFRRMVALELAGPQVRSLVALAVKRLVASPAAWPGRWGVAVRASLTGGNLSAAQIDAVTDHALAIQADAAAAWESGWGDWVEQARAAGKVSDARWRRYARQAVPTLTMEVRPRVEIDAEDLPAIFPNPAARVGRSSPLVLYSSGTSVRLGDGPWRDLAGGGSVSGGLTTTSSGSSGQNFPMNLFHAELAPGPLRVSVRRRVSVREGFRDADAALAEWTEESAVDFTLLPPGEASAAAMFAPAKEPAVLASVHVGQLQRNGSDPNYIRLDLSIDAPPVDLAFDVSLRDASGREWEMRPVNAQAGGNLSSGGGGRADGLSAGVVDVLLRPSRRAAERSVDVTTFWGRGVIFRGVKIEPATSPIRSSTLDRDPTPAEPLPAAGGEADAG